MGLRDRVALVFGGGTGIGRATAVEFAREGAAVVVAGRRNAALAESIEEIEAAGGRAIGIVSDVSRPEDVTRVVTATVAELGRLDAVANCAAIVDREERMLTGPVELFDRIMGVNLRGAWLVVRTAAQTMIDTGAPGAILTVSSINALRPGTVDYSTSKAGVEGLTRSAAKVLGRHGIRVNALRSGFVDTAMLRYAWDVAEDVPFPIGPDSDLVPLGRVGQPSEAAKAIVWLCSLAASYITGTCLDLDGGLLAS
jgi:NAD(P)-dependent dehydrogenase (short-subunit alcohol dehydrogenase family)